MRRNRLIIAAAALWVFAGLAIWGVKRKGERIGKRPAAVERRSSIFATETGEEKRAATGAIEGVVSDAAGTGVGGAVVVLTRRRPPDAPPTQQLRPVATVQADQGGRFRFDGLSAGDYGLTAMAAKFAPGERSPVKVGEGIEKVTITLGPGGLSLSGHVSDAGGGPVPGATVRATFYGGAGQIPRFYQARADADGAYQLALAKGSYGLWVEAEGYAPIRDGITLARDEKRDLHLMPAARIYGKVVERATHQPVPDAEVWVVTDRRYDMPMPRDVKTDAEGSFAFNDLPPATYAVAARQGRLAGYSNMVPVSPMQAVTNLVVEVDRGLAVKGQVVDAEGKGVGSVQLSLYKREPPFDRGAWTRSQPDGTFTVEGIFSGQYTLSSMKEGFAQARKDLKLGAKDVDGLVVKLASGAVVSGTVVNASGAPVAGAQVFVEMVVKMDGGGRMTSGRSDRTDAAGKFEVKDIESALLNVKAKHPEHGSGSVDSFTIGAGEKKTLKLVLGGGASIAGVVRDDSGAPVANVRVYGYQRSAGGGSRGEDDVSALDGAFKLGGLSAGTYEVTARRTNVSSPTSTTVTVAAGEQKTGVIIELPRAGLTIRGQVVAADGAPVVGASVTALPEQKGRPMRFGARDGRSFLSGEGGAFTIEDLAKGPYTVSAFHSEHAEGEVSGVEAGASSVRVQLPAGASMAGVVAGSDNQPVADYTVALLPGPAEKESALDRNRRLSLNAYDNPIRRIHDPAGGFQFDHLKAAAYELKVTTGDGRSGSSVVSLQSGEKKTGLRITLASGVRIVGRVVDFETGAPVAASVTAMAIGTPSRPDPVRAGADGAFALENVIADQPLRLLAFADGYVPDGPELESPRGKPEVNAGTIKLLRGDLDAKFAPGERGLADFKVTIRDGHPVVANVQKGGLAEKAGIQSGDLLLAIDGRDARELGAGAIRYLLTGKPGSSVAVEVQSGDKTRKVTVTRFDPASVTR